MRISDSDGRTLFAVATFAKHLNIAGGIAAAIFHRNDVVELQSSLTATFGAPRPIPMPNERPNILGALTGKTQRDEHVAQIALDSFQIIDNALGDDEGGTGKWRQRRDPSLCHRIVEGVEIFGGLANHEEEFIDGSVNNLGRCRVHAATLLQ